MLIKDMEISKIFRKKNDSKSDFSAFFTHASEGQKLKLLEKVVREANEDQRRLMQEAQGVKSKTT